MLRVEGARAWPLNGLDVEIPLGMLVALTGVNGAGCHALAFDTIAREAQGQILELCSSTTVSSEFPRAEADGFEGLPATVALRRSSNRWGINATVGTVVGLDDGLAQLLLLGSELAISPTSLSFLHQEGRCDDCAGTGERATVDSARLVADHALSLAAGAITPWQQRAQAFHRGVLSGLCERVGIDFEAPWSSLSQAARNLVLFGNDGDDYAGVVEDMERRLDACASDSRDLDWLKGFLEMRPCARCDGSRLNLQARSISLCGCSMATLFDSTSHGLLALLQAFGGRGDDADRCLRKIEDKRVVLEELGLGELPLRRPVECLSRGESQRLHLAELSMSSLTGALFVVDEPTAGLHVQERASVFALLHRLVRRGNSVVATTHERATINEAAWVIDLSDGEVVGQGPPAVLGKNMESVTASYLRGESSVNSQQARKPAAANWLRLKSAEVAIPVARMTCLVGASGTGKSTLLGQLCSALADEHAHESDVAVAACLAISADRLERKPSVTPATCLGLAEVIALLYSEQPAAQALQRSDFLASEPGGRCVACQGQGHQWLELSDCFTPCTQCGGQRFDSKTLQVRYQDFDIASLFGLRVDEAVEPLRLQPEAMSRLDCLQRVGLGYLQLGQPATSLSDGELQRLVLAQALARGSAGHCVYLIDDVSDGLHWAGLQVVLELLDGLVKAGNTIVVADHHPEVIGASDYLIEFDSDGFALKAV